METPNLKILQRVITLYQTMPRKPQAAFEVEELRQKLKNFYTSDCDEKSVHKAIQRDLKLLALILSAGQLLRTEGQGNQPARFRLSADASIESFKPELSLVLVMANTYLRQYLPPDIYNKVEGFFEAAEQQLKQHTALEDWQNRIRFIHADYSPTVEDWGLTINAGNIYHALLNQNYWLNAQYQREYDNAIQDYILKPHGIINRGRKQFLIASKINGHQTELRTFVMNRFIAVNLIAEKLTVQVDDYDIDELIRQQEYDMAYFDRELVNLKIRCDDELLNDITENPLSHDQIIEKTQHGYFYVTAPLMISQTIVDWLVGQAHRIRVIEPQELFYRIRHYVSKAAELYEVDWEIHEDEEYPM